MGFDRVGKRPGADAGGIQQEKAGSPENRASDCTKKEGLTMTRAEAEEKIIDLMDEIRKVYFEYSPEGCVLNVAVFKDQLYAFNDYWKKGNKFPIDCRKLVNLS